MAIDKIQSESINLADNFAFTGTVSGAGGLVKLFTASDVSSATAFTLDSTYINSTYDNYRMYLGYKTASDSVVVYIRFFVSGSEVTTYYSYENAALTSSTYGYDARGGAEMRLGLIQGNATAETGTIVLDLTNVNSTDVATRIHGFQSYNSTNGNAVGRVFQGGQDINGYTSVVNGIKFYISSGNIIVKNFALYGVAK